MNNNNKYTITTVNVNETRRTAAAARRRAAGGAGGGGRPGQLLNLRVLQQISASDAHTDRFVRALSGARCACAPLRPDTGLLNELSASGMRWLFQCFIDFIRYSNIPTYLTLQKTLTLNSTKLIYINLDLPRKY